MTISTASQHSGFFSPFHRPPCPGGPFAMLSYFSAMNGGALMARGIEFPGSRWVISSAISTHPWTGELFIKTLFPAPTPCPSLEPERIFDPLLRRIFYSFCLIQPIAEVIRLYFSGSSPDHPGASNGSAHLNIGRPPDAFPSSDLRPADV